MLRESKTAPTMLRGCLTATVLLLVGTPACDSAPPATTADAAQAPDTGDFSDTAQTDDGLSTDTSASDGTPADTQTVDTKNTDTNAPDTKAIDACRLPAVVASIAAPSSKDCGTVSAFDDPAPAYQCAVAALAAGKPFHVIFYKPGIDSKIGVAWVYT